MLYIYILGCFLAYNRVLANELQPTLIDPPETKAPTLDISQEDILQALSYGREQRNVRFEEEDNYVKAGNNISKTEASAKARAFPPMYPKSQNLHRSRLQLEDATEWLAKKYNLNNQEISMGLNLIELPTDHPVVQECLKLQEIPPCDASAKYRTADGSCNNLKNPTWGWAPGCYARLLKTTYENGYSSPHIHDKEGTSVLPNVRVVSTTMARDVNLTSKDFSHMVIAFGQFIMHDTLQTSIIGSGENMDLADCCSSEKKPSYCIPFDVPKDDYYFSKLNKTCISVVRTSSCSHDCKLGTPRRHVTQQTAFVDGSQIYSSYPEETHVLRSLKGGELQSQSSKYGELLPPSLHPVFDQCSETMDNDTCFETGDFRSIAHPGLITMHTIFLRQHNRIAKIISSDYPTATDEEVFQETRRIIGAQLQRIMYKELLPLLVGKTLMDYFKLNVLEEGYTTYDPEVNPTAYSEFAGATARIGHTLIQNSFSQFAENNVREDETVDLIDSAFRPQCLHDGKLNSITRGLYHQGFQKFDRHFVSYLTNELLEVQGKDTGSDLFAVNTLRSRDLGLPSYTKVLHYCYNVTISSFEDLNLVMNEESWKAIQQVYSHVDDIELYPGGLSERPLKNSILGPTFACVVGKQFHNVKYGDRYYFEHNGQAGSFTEGQLKEIRKMTLSEVICANTEIQGITKDLFHLLSESNKQVDCNSIERVDFKNWLNRK